MHLPKLAKLRDLLKQKMSDTRPNNTDELEANKQLLIISLYA